MSIVSFERPPRDHPARIRVGHVISGILKKIRRIAVESCPNDVQFMAEISGTKGASDGNFQRISQADSDDSSTDSTPVVMDGSGPRDSGIEGDSRSKILRHGDTNLR